MMSNASQLRSRPSPPAPAPLRATEPPSSQEPPAASVPRGWRCWRRSAPAKLGVTVESGSGRGRRFRRRPRRVCIRRPDDIYPVGQRSRTLSCRGACKTVSDVSAFVLGFLIVLAILLLAGAFLTYLVVAELKLSEASTPRKIGWVPDRDRLTTVRRAHPDRASEARRSPVAAAARGG
jgi:hypothetical protein